MQNTSLVNKSKRIVYLDYLRIIACLGVFACHLWVGGIIPAVVGKSEYLKQLPPECTGIHGDALYRCGWQTLFPFPNDSLDHFLFNCFNFFFGSGYQAVHLFFVLSGFGLALSALLSEKKEVKIYWFEFLKRRFLRLYPSYWIVLAIYLAAQAFEYKSPLGLLKTYFLGSIFLNLIPATWFLPILLQLYLIFPVLFYFLKKLSAKNFLLLMLLIKVISSAAIITGSVLMFNKVIGFGDGALAPAGNALPRLFEFCLGMAIAKTFVSRNCCIKVFTQFCKPTPLLLGFFLEGTGLLLSMKFGTFELNGRVLPIGLFISDALIGIGISILSLNFVFLIHPLLKGVNSLWLNLISNITYEAYLVHGVLLGYFVALLVNPFLKITDSYTIVCLLYLLLLFVFTVLNFFLGWNTLTFKVYCTKKWAFLANS